MLRKLDDASDSKSGIDEMMKKVFSEVKVAVERQITTVKFYSEPENMSEEKRIKIGYTPLTNSGWESNLGDLTYDVTRSAGSDTKMNTFSNKNMIRKNKVFESKKWKEMSAKRKVCKVEVG